MQAPHWSLKARFIDFCPTLLFEQLKALLHLCQHSAGQSTAHIIRSLSSDHKNENDGNTSLVKETYVMVQNYCLCF